MNEKQIVAKEKDIHSWWSVSIMQFHVTTNSDKMTYRRWRFVSCPNWVGIVPVSSLPPSHLKSKMNEWRVKKMNNVMMNEKQIFAKAKDIHSRWTVGIMQLLVTTSSDILTYSPRRFVSCPNWDGMVPVSWLPQRYLKSKWIKNKDEQYVLMNEKEIVAKEKDIHSWCPVRIMQLQVTTSSDKMTYRVWRFVSCPNWDGMVPVSWLR
jgi:hypothetical protein